MYAILEFVGETRRGPFETNLSYGKGSPKQRSSQMSLVKDILNGGNVVTGLALGVGALVVLPLVGPMLRPAAKAVIKGGLRAYDQATRLVTGAVEEVGDVVAEAQQEIRATAAAQGPSDGRAARAP